MVPASAPSQPVTGSRLGLGSLLLSAVVALSFFVLTLGVGWLMREVVGETTGTEESGLASFLPMTLVVAVVYVALVYATGLCSVISLIVGTLGLMRSASRRWLPILGIGIACLVLAYLIFGSPLDILSPVSAN